MINAKWSLEQNIKILAEKSNAVVEVFDRAEFKFDIATAAYNAIAQEKFSEVAEIFRQVISLGMLKFGLKKKHDGWYLGLDGRDFIDPRNAVSD